MQSRWEELRERLSRSARTLRAHRDYNRIRSRRDSLAPHPDPEELLSFMHDPQADLDAKDLIYADLLREVRSPEPEGAIAATLLWVGLWPGLDALWRESLGWWNGDQRDIVAAITGQFTRQITRTNVGGIVRVAATLVKNTRRNVRAQRMREWAEAAQREEVSESEVDPASEKLDEEAPDLEVLALTVLGDDADLVLLVGREELDLRNAAGVLGISHDAARQRLGRYLARLRRACKKKFD